MHSLVVLLIMLIALLVEVVLYRKGNIRGGDIAAGFVQGIFVAYWLFRLSGGH